MTAIRSATGVASQIPWIPSRAGSTNMVMNINTKVREKANTADTIPLESAVNIPLIKILKPMINMDLSEISIIEKETCCLITVEIDQDTTFEEEVELVTAKTTEYQLGRLHDASYGSMIPVTSLQQGQFDDYCNIFIEISLPTQKDKQMPRQKTGLHMQPGGRYLRAFHRGNWDAIPLRYQEILDFAQKRGLTLSGFSYEKGMNENVIDRVEDCMVQIEIPIQSL